MPAKSKYSEQTWIEARRLIEEEGHTQKRAAEMVGMPHRTLAVRASREGWSRPEIGWGRRALDLVGPRHATGPENKRKAREKGQLIGQLCDRLAHGIPLNTALRLTEITPRRMQIWCEEDEDIRTLIESAIAAAETVEITRMRESKDWKAHERLLGMIQPEYDRSSADAGEGPKINVVVNIPAPRAVQPGDSAVDITPEQRQILVRSDKAQPHNQDDDS